MKQIKVGLVVLLVELIAYQVEKDIRTKENSNDEIEKIWGKKENV